MKDRSFAILNEDEIESCKNIYALLRENKQNLSQRVWFGKNARELSGKWYGMMYLDAFKNFATPHFLTPSLSSRSNFTLGKGWLFATGTAGITSIVPHANVDESLLYLLGVLNSTLLSFYAIGHIPVFSGGYYKFSAPYLKKLPVRTIDFSDPEDVAQHDWMVDLVERMLELHERLAGARIERERTVIGHQISATDRQIDRLVYELYSLTDDDIMIVEEATAR